MCDTVTPLGGSVASVLVFMSAFFGFGFFNIQSVTSHKENIDK